MEEHLPRLCWTYEVFERVGSAVLRWCLYLPSQRPVALGEISPPLRLSFVKPEVVISGAPLTTRVTRRLEIGLLLNASLLDFARCPL